jgi:hypothetical protein
MKTRARILGAAAAGALLATLAALVGIAGATTAADPPTVRAVPAIVGDARVGSTLTAHNGDWAGTRPITYAYQWRSCGTGGGNCVDVAGATAKTYVLAAADVGHRMRVLVRATNTAGSSSAVSRPTATVKAATTPPPPPPTGPAGQIKLADGKTSIPVTSVSSPQRLVVSEVRFSPNPVRSLNPFEARFRVSDTRGFVVRGALVYMIGIPYNRIAVVPEQATGEDGYVTFTAQPTARFPLVAGGALVVFVRARKPGENLLAGVSTRRLVQASVGAPS